jgi:hypothetical protein
MKWLKSIRRKAWWLISCSAIYAVIALGYLGYEVNTGLLFSNHSRFDEYLMYGQMIWVTVMASPLIPGTALNRWVFNT